MALSDPQIYQVWSTLKKALHRVEKAFSTTSTLTGSVRRHLLAGPDRFPRSLLIICSQVPAIALPLNRHHDEDDDDAKNNCDSNQFKYRVEHLSGVSDVA